MSIAEMREYTALVKQGSGTLRHRQRLLSVHRARVKEKISEWTLALKLIDRKIDFYGEWLTTGKQPEGFLPQGPSRTRRKRRRVR
jgi:DNA-binding transcriptional MerR regulator